jgi:hypothetical protein
MIRDILIANCLTIGIVIGVACCLTLEINRKFNMNGTTQTTLRLIPLYFR